MKVFGILKPFFQKGLKRVKGSALAGFGRLSPAGACLGVPTINEKSAAPAYPSGMLSRMSRPQRAQNLMDSSRPAIPSPESDRTADRHVCFRLTPSAALSIGCLGRCGGRSFFIYCSPAGERKGFRSLRRAARAPPWTCNFSRKIE